MGKLKQYWLITGVVIVAMLGAGWFFGMKPQAAKATQIKADTEAQVAANAKLSGEIKRLQDQADGVVAQEKRLREISAILPATPGLPKLVRSVSDVSQKSGIDLTSMTPGALTAITAAAPAEAGAAAPAAPAPAPAPALFSLPVTLTLNGDFTQVRMLLGMIEKLPRAYLVDSLTVTPGAPVGPSATPEQKKKANLLTVNLVGHVFVKPAPVAEAPATAPAAPTTEK